MKKLTLTLLAAAALFAQGPGFGPGGPGGPQGEPPAPDELKAYLTLTDAQVTQLQQLKQQEMQAIQTDARLIPEKQKALEEAISKNSDAATIGRLVLDIKAIRDRIQATQKKYADLAIAVLTTAQKTKLASLADAMKLHLTIQQAIGLSLLEPPQPPEGAGPGMRGPGPMMRERRPML
jgi:Spy/CpxP family protein refolding chaperone